MAAHQSPDHAKQQQREHGVPQSAVPDHGVAAHIAGDDQPDDAGGQAPVEQTGGQIPDADLVHVNSWRTVADSNGYKPGYASFSGTKRKTLNSTRL